MVDEVPDGDRQDGEVPDRDRQDDQQPDGEEPREQQADNDRQRRRRQGGWPPYDTTRFTRHILGSSWPVYQGLLNSPAFLQQLQATNALMSSPVLDRYAKIAASLPTAQIGADLAAKVAQGYPLQNWSTIASTAAWAQISDSLRRLVDGIFPVPNIAAWVDALHLDYYPPNWPSDLRIKEIRELADEEGIPLCWVPRAEVIDALRTAESVDRRTVLLTQRDAVLDDCAVALNEVVAPELKQYREAAEDVLAAMRDGHHRPAQALAMNVVDAALRGVLFDDVSGFKFYGPVVKRVEKTRDCELKDFRRSATLWPLLRLFTHFSPGKDTVPDRPNRHATAHTVDGVQYTPVNALIATMFAASVLREVQESLILDGEDASPGELEAGPDADGPSEE